MNRRSKTFAWIVGPATLGLVACGAVDDPNVAPDLTDEATEESTVRPERGGHGKGGRGRGGRGPGRGGRGGTAAGGNETGGTAGAGGTETGGTAGTGATGGGGGAIGELVGALDGRLMQFPCGDSPATDDCNGAGYVVDGVVTPCVNGQSQMVLDHPIAGAPGARYLVTMHFYGIMEPKVLGSGVTRDAPIGTFSDRNGGTPLPWASAPGGTNFPISTYSAYEIRVHDDAGQEIARYFLNSDAAEGHWTFIIDYEKTIEVVGGGFVRLRRLDNNCRLIKNCGASPGFPCDVKARVIDVSEADPPVPDGAYPTGLDQPGLNQTAQHAGQWWFIDVTAVQPL
jgi:hypothetical protein